MQKRDGESHRTSGQELWKEDIKAYNDQKGEAEKFEAIVQEWVCSFHFFFRVRAWR
jgi:hypothetical protein